MALWCTVTDDAEMAPTLHVPHGSPPADHAWMAEDRASAPVVVAPLDGSGPSRRTTAVAVGLARRLGWRVALVPVPLGATARDRRDRLVAAALDERAELLASPVTNLGPAGCLALAHTAPCPVLAVPLSGRWEPTARGPVLCGIDNSGGSASLARVAARLAVAFGHRLELVHVATSSGGGAGRRLAAGLGPLWRALHTLETMPTVDVVVERGEPAERLCALSERERALLVIGTPTDAGDGGHVGGVASTILAGSRVPVVLVSGRATEAEGASVRAARVAAA